MTTGLAVFGSVATLIFAAPACAPFLAPLALLYLATMSAYRPGCRELKRLEAVMAVLGRSIIQSSP